jgi:hypothetical protein
MRDDQALDSALRALAEQLDAASRETTAAQAMAHPARVGRRAPLAHRERRLVAVLAAVAVTAAAVVVAVVVPGDEAGRVEVGEQPGRAPTTGTTAPEDPVPGSGSGEPSPSTSPEVQLDGEIDAGALPESGIAIVEGGDLVVLDFDGTELARGPAPDPVVWQDRPRLTVGADLIARFAEDTAEAPEGCDRAAGAGGVRVALCGGQPQVRSRIDRVDPTGGVTTLVVNPGMHGGSWRWAVPSPDGRWVLGQWSGECESPDGYLVPAGGGPSVPVLSGEGGVRPPESFGVGWTPDGRAVVELFAGACGAGDTDPGIYLVDPDTLASTLVRPGSAAALVWTLEGGFSNAREVAMARARAELGLEGCCGEPSHGGEGVTDGVVWEGVEVAVGGAPAASADGDQAGQPGPIEFAGGFELVPFAGGTAVTGVVDGGSAGTTAGVSLVAFTCGDTRWSVGGGLSDPDADAEVVLAVAEALVPHLYCSLGDPPASAG